MKEESISQIRAYNLITKVQIYRQNRASASCSLGLEKLANVYICLVPDFEGKIHVY